MARPFGLGSEIASQRSAGQGTDQEVDRRRRGDGAAASKAKPSDSDLGTAVAAALKKEKEAGSLKGFNIDLSVKEGVVVLDGNVSNDEQAELASRTVAVSPVCVT